jgi:hypothetical protein
MSEGGKGKENFLTSPGQARDKIGAEQKKGGRSRPLNFSSRVGLHLRNQQLARARAIIILPVLRCPLLADADISTRPLR